MAEKLFATNEKSNMVIHAYINLFYWVICSDIKHGNGFTYWYFRKSFCYKKTSPNTLDLLNIKRTHDLSIHGISSITSIIVLSM